MDDRPPPTELLLADEVFRIQGAAFAVSNAVGHGFLEGVYHECLALEFAVRRLPFQSMPKLTISYRGVQLQHTYEPDFICFGSIIVELKALRAIAPEHRAQILNYLRAANLRVGLLINFGAGSKVQVER